LKVLDKILIFNKIDTKNIKIELMKENSFAFFRGTSHLFFEHLSKFSNHRVLKDSDLLCWIQGDSHINNLGFSNKRCSSVKDVRFDINDFDEAFIGNPFLDIIRFGVSVGFFFDDLNNHQKEVLRNIEVVHLDTEIIEYFLKRYLKYASKKGHIRYKYSKRVFMPTHRKKSLKRADEAHQKSRINKFTFINDDIREFDFANDKIEPLDKVVKNRLIKALSKIYNKKDILDICKRVTAGVGSAHLDRYYMLLKVDDDELLLEIKEQLNPSFVDYFPNLKKIYESQHSNKSASQLHIEAKQKMIVNSDVHLQTFSFDNKDFLIKSIFNAKYSLDAIDFFTNKSLEEFEENLKEYIDFCAIAISNAHKKSSLDIDKFTKKMSKIKKNDFFEIFTMILKSYATNVALYSHYVRDLNKI
jgi:uncharacterized protein (DUF2252 family)